MLQMLTWKKIAAGVVFVSLASAVVIAQQQGPARGNHEWAPPVPQGKHHNLAATLETVQWGWLDPREKPKLVVELRRHGLDRDHDAFARQGAARHDDRAGR